MIGRLVGTLVAQEPDGGFVLDVGGVGYEALAPVGALGRATQLEDGRIVVHVHTHVREDALQLFAFASEDERSLFRLLTAVHMVGPKVALTILSALPPAELVAALASRDLKLLCKIPHVGRKTAERLVLELAEKLPALSFGAPGAPAAPAAPPPRQQRERLVAALTGMGYRPAQAEAAADALGPRVESGALTDLLREALALLVRAP